MNEIAYIGEHLAPAIIGRGLIYLSLIAGIFSLFFYFRSLKSGSLADLKQRNFGRLFYLIQTFSIVGISAALFYIIVNHYFEYAYAFKHSSSLMPGKYIISSFWAGQEGSFLLWALFIGLYGIGAMLTARKLESGVMSVVVLAQLILVTMVLGLNFFGISIGSDPFLLLREVPENMSNDFFKNPDYLSFIRDGNGLNPLLENPWMVIHPPMLFMGYATAIFPYAFAFASLVQGDKRYWLKPVLPWMLLSVGLLGTGLLLGGAWAYQSLTFGGFWAWDPVENASLVPWMVLVAALHYMLLTYKRDKYYYGTYIFTFLGFIMVVYASYLTRSGVLGETSVHAFGDDGRSVQLILFTVIFILLPLWQLIRNRKNIRANDLPELFTREFLMMYGAIVMLLAAFQVISTTSVPVINKVIGTNMAPPSDVVSFYNTWQLPFAIMMTLLLSIGQYLSYGKNDIKSFLRNIIYPFVLALIVAIWGFIADNDMSVVHGVFLFCIVFTILTSVAYLFRFASGRGNSAAGITHVGFGVFLLGVLIAFSNTETLSSGGVPGMPGGGDNMMLFKGEQKSLGRYQVSYSGIEEKRDETFYRIDFLEEGKDGELYHRFSLHPSVKYNEMMGNVHNPDTRNMLSGDIYMYITFAEDRAKRMPDGYVYSGSVDFTLGDTLEAGRVPVIFDSLYISNMSTDAEQISIMALLKAKDSLDREQTYPLVYTVDGNTAESGVVEIPGSGIKLRFDKVSEMARTINVGIFEKKPEFVVVKILHFPWIFILWTGAVIMFAGITVGIWKRAVKARNAAE
ncbi:cytochrome c biogenesis protein CcsA [Lentimicrobium sp.]|uniref:cytochrome c biogenesis protein CcsA n=1 Tax=Lentimicrobium sp. TaxID=2034841 RepID=UPI002CB384AF|nr:cytochrome c biogenesis protein CcsA [Lentimicrobium sp.]HPJ61775.1 cytochrome c biogenesis protein CcsA [Lentimicrobium sp.]